MMNNRVLEEDVRQFAEHFELRKDLWGKSFLITGGTGLIGSILVKCLLALNEDIRITIPVRDEKKARTIFSDDINKLDVIIAPSLEDWSKSIRRPFNYIIHCASPTAGKYMEGNPVETFCMTYEVTNNLLRLARDTETDSFVFVSSLEYYGQIMDERLIVESDQGYINLLSARSSYPMGKRVGEYLCYAFAKEYGVHARSARLTQTFGAGVSPNDNRVFAQFVRSVIKGEDVVLHTMGDSAKPYCYTTDAVSAILHILLRGKDGESYNVANEATYISIKDLAEFLRDNFNPCINVHIELKDNMGYAPVTKLRLSTKKLRDLGWKPRYGLKDMFRRLICSISNR